MVGGGEKSFLDLISHLPEPRNALAVVPGEGELATLIRQKGIKTKVVDLPSMKPWNIHNVILSLKKYRNLIREYRPSLIYANGPRAAFYGGLSGRVLNIPVIWHCRIADRDRYLDHLLCRLSTGIIANSQATARRFKPRFQQKVRTIYNGIDIQWLQDRDVQKPDLIQPDWKVILVAARISKSKRHDLALSAFEKIAPSDPRLHLVCVGAKDQLDPGLHDNLMMKAGQSQFSDRIHWVGQADDMRPWYKSADILLFPAENEAFGRVLVEAMACGVPVIATRSGGVPEIVREEIDGILVTPGDTGELAKAVLRLLKDEGLRNQMSKTASKRAESFSLDTHIKSIVEVFEYTVSDSVYAK